MSVDSALYIFVANILSAAECMKKRFKRFGCKKHKSPWFDNDCLNAKNAARKSLQIFKKTSLEGDRLTFIQNKRTYRQLIRERKNNNNKTQTKLSREITQYSQ